MILMNLLNWEITLVFLMVEDWSRLEEPEDIILNPADDYVKAFVKDVNRSKVLRARTIMTKLDQFDKSSVNPSSTYKYDEDTFIEDIVPKVLKDRSTIEVIDKEGMTTGFITSDELSVALTKTNKPSLRSC